LQTLLRLCFYYFLFFQITLLACSFKFYIPVLVLVQVVDCKHFTIVLLLFSVLSSKFPLLILQNLFSSLYKYRYLSMNEPVEDILILPCYTRYSLLVPILDLKHRQAKCLTFPFRATILYS
jgi:hypothetical protein